MLVNEKLVDDGDEILSMIAAIHNRESKPKKVAPGMYEIGHFGGSHFLPNYDHYPEFGDLRGAYGVCDCAEQILDHYPELEAKGRKFVVTLTKVLRDEQPESGGWRWHKWGEYIGTKNPTHEYLYHDTHIDEVFVYHIYERKP